ncbi:Cdc7p-Dbf4p kinase complex regulatory subunit [Blomia tropicalis]|nr:Cdc7p-Dbf4p kinase complex regulatory subunit [Blomia tropicalis]
MDKRNNTPDQTNQPKPMQKKRFYLEIINSPQLSKTVSDDIKRLGGKIESFLNADVNYVITNRPKNEWPQKVSPSSTQNTESTTMSMMKPLPTMSRASKMLKSAQTTVKVTDPLELARKLDKKIIHSNDLIAFIRNHLNEPFTGIDDNRSSDSSNNRRLLPPYIKVLDNSNKYRPNFKELAEWPEINFDYQPELCPFYKPRKPILSNASQQSNKSNTTNNGKNDKFQTVLTTPIMNTTTPTINIKSIPTRNVSKRKHVTFCEICHKEFIDLEKHLADPEHSNFLSNDQNFSELLGVIKSLPPFIIPSTLTNTSSDRFNSSLLNNKTNDLTKEVSTSMKAINSVKHTHSFMPIHDLVEDGDNREQQFKAVTINQLIEENQH